ncbi:hypothetical protein ACH3XW_35840 [Acanthocheilonema viteae]
MKTSFSLDRFKKNKLLILISNSHERNDKDEFREYTSLRITCFCYLIIQSVLLSMIECYRLSKLRRTVCYHNLNY